MVVLGGCTDTTVPAGGPDYRDRPDDLAQPEPGPSWLEDPDTGGSGKLSPASFPSPEELGEDWALADAGAGHGRDTADRARVLERDVFELMDNTLFPDGCRSSNPLPVPTTALESRYIRRGEPVTAIGLAFSSYRLAQAFYILRLEDLILCAGNPAQDGRRPVGKVVEPAAGLSLADLEPDDRVDRSTELAILAGSSVMLLYTPVPLGSEPFGDDGLEKLARHFRG
jgi:hypothetical protein